MIWPTFELFTSALVRLCTLLLFTPIFFFPGVLVGAIGAFAGNIYIKAQLSVKREMSNARAPVLGHLGAAILALEQLLVARKQALEVHVFMQDKWLLQKVQAAEACGVDAEHVRACKSLAEHNKLAFLSWHDLSVVSLR